MSNFPEGFLWGAASGAFQSEGAYDEDGKGLTAADLRCMESSRKLKTAGTRTASDFYHKYKEDIALMKECGLKCFRFSISWARIYTDGTGTVNQKGLEFYDNVINELKRSGIEPIVTLYHFDLPQWMSEQYNVFFHERQFAIFWFMPGRVSNTLETGSNTG